MTWIIISICLYLIGMLPVYLWWREDRAEKESHAETMFWVSIWPLSMLMGWGIVIYDYLVHLKEKVKS